KVAIFNYACWTNDWDFSIWTNGIFRLLENPYNPKSQISNMTVFRDQGCQV
ncbi:5328_t:CDS:1, partial [Gigaspora rosea]